jgi:hypothetical protein
MLAKSACAFSIISFAGFFAAFITITPFGWIPWRSGNSERDLLMSYKQQFCAVQHIFCIAPSALPQRLAGMPLHGEAG